ncbi:MAG: signal peptide peptidase SppA [Woeseiaceae bacterium]|nr:signal peptide peptidase SppA [Woeseiaceae bacterium]
MSAIQSLGRGFRLVWKGIDTVRKLLHLILLLLLFSVVGGLLAPEPARLPASAALIVTPVGTLVEELEGDPFDRALAEVLEDAVPQTLLRDLVDALRYAQDDERIEVVVLELGGLGGSGLSKLAQAAEAVQAVRDSGKRVIATANFYSQAAYYIAAHADDIYMHPDGVFLPQGIGLYSNYFAEAIDKLEIDWNVFRVGTHKSAVEPFTRMEMSAEDRASRQSLADQLWDMFQEGVAAGRGLGPDALDRFAEDLLVHQSNHSGDLAAAAAELGFFDRLLTRSELQAELIDIVGEDEDNERGYRAVGWRDYLKQRRLLEGPATAETNVAVVVASGEMLNGRQPPGLIGGVSTSELLRRARADDSIEAVVLRIDTPGGSSFAAEQIRNEIEALRAAGKPVVASMSSIAASGGYWIAMAADAILARESTITGSIGIFLMLPTFQRTLDEIGIATDGVGTTRWSGQFRLDRELSDDTRQFLQNFVEKGYDDFISMVAVYRDMDKTRVDELAQGQVWTGRQALEVGLIDEIGDIDAAIARAADLAGLEEGDYGTNWLAPKLSSFEQMIVDALGGAAGLGIRLDALRPSPSAAAARLLGAVDDALMPFVWLDDPNGLYSHCFCRPY